MKKLYKALSLIMALAIIFCLPVTASADGTTIDYSKKASLELYKYDMTTAEADGAWTADSYVSAGTHEQSIIDSMADYAVQGVEFSYVKLADIAVKDIKENNDHQVVTLYGFEENSESEAFLDSIGLTYADAYHTENSIHYFMADTLNDALAEALSANSTAVKNSLENFVADNGTAMTVTDQQGHSKASGLELGLYLVLETRIPENVTSTCDPFLISLPMTEIDGSGWNYEITVYPKNATGMPTLEKTVREATADFSHNDTVSVGDSVDYRITSTLPSITSEATYLSCYSFADTAARGINFIKDDVVIEFFKDAACTELISTWDESSGKFTVSYADNTMAIEMTEAGLSEINTATAVYGADSVYSGYSGCTMRISYSCNISNVLSIGSANTNTVELTWKRSNADFSDSISDDAHIYSYGIDLTKKFSDDKGKLENVRFTIRNESDDYYVAARLVDGIYYVSGQTDEAQATQFVPNADGHIIVRGFEDDSYIIKETGTDDGYVLFRDEIKLVFTTTESGNCAECDEALLAGMANINGKNAAMKDGIASLTVVNTRGFNLPQTGSYGTWMFTVCGILVMGAAAFMLLKLSRKEKSK